MFAFLFTLLILAFLALVGFACISMFQPKIRVLKGLLLSPALGLAAVILPVFFINRLGIPIKDFGKILLSTMVFLSVFVLVINRPVFPIRRLTPYMGILICALFLAGRPMFSYGFDWLSFANDDMANYCLGAQRFLNHGFFDQPNIGDLATGKDYSQIFWFMHVAGGHRAASELMLAVVMAFSNLNAHQIFMPVIMALHLALIASVGAMVVKGGKARRTPQIAMVMLALSPMTTLGALYQLIAQVGGLALLTAAITLSYRPGYAKSTIKLFISNVPLALILCSIFIWYPEVLPFFVLGWLVNALIMLKYSNQSTWQILKPTLVVSLLVLIVLNKYVSTALVFMLAQASGGMHSAELSSVLFPYFLIPSGIAAFWGLIPIAGGTKEPILSLSIFAGLILFYWVGRYAFNNQIRRGDPPVSILLVMVAIGSILFYGNNDFGLFKLVMFAQPYLIGVLAIELGRKKWENVPSRLKLVLSILLVPIVITQNYYVSKSTGEEFGGFSEIPYASTLKINNQFNELVKTISKNTTTTPVVILDTDNIVLAKLQALYTNEIETHYPSRPFFKGIFRGFLGGNGEATNMAKLVANQYQEKITWDNKFESYKANLSSSHRLIYISSQFTSNIFNLYNSSKLDTNYFSVNSAEANKLQFIHSELGNHYYLPDFKNVTAFYHIENDPMFYGQKFSALGKRLVFEVINPSRQPRLVMELTSTVTKQFGSSLPNPSVEKTPINFVGRGSGRIFSAPIKLSKIDGASYISVDMERDGRQFPTNTKWLMLLYGRSIPEDNRLITTFGRDISLLSEDQYQKIQPPSNLKNFPSDLANKNLEYSGIYEDGWISENSFFVLSPNSNSKVISIAGSIPLINDKTFSTILVITVNGREVGSKELGLGEFELKVPITSLATKQRIELAFSKYQTLPGSDMRIAPAKIKFIGFE